ncbi:MAG: helix-turn-helix domain-containing protein, partial [Clostridiales bacterium]|nr:helix-turn-helix domain-containing protein [Clostridiales bacterium]
MPNGRKIYFKTFGNFDILVNKVSVLSKGFRQQGFNKLLVFFLLNRDRVFGISTLIEKVWPNKEYHDNNSIMRTQIFRLKRQLAELVPDLEFSLEFSHGGYCFSMDQKNVVMDTDIFQDLCDKVFSVEQAQPVSAARGGGFGGAAGFDGFGGSGSAAGGFGGSGFAAGGVGPGTGPLFGAARTERPAPRGISVDMTASRSYNTDREVSLLCREALDIYQNGFLSEDTFDGSWLTSYRLNYRRMWFRLIET